MTNPRMFLPFQRLIMAILSLFILISVGCIKGQSKSFTSGSKDTVQSKDYGALISVYNIRNNNGAILSAWTEKCIFYEPTLFGTQKTDFCPGNCLLVKFSKQNFERSNKVAIKDTSYFYVTGYNSDGIYSFCKEGDFEEKINISVQGNEGGVQTFTLIKGSMLE